MTAPEPDAAVEAAAPLAEPIQRWDREADIVPEHRHLMQFPFLDEFVAENVDVHFEAMGHAQFWVGVRDRATGRSWRLDFGAVNERAKGYSMCEEER